MAQLTEKLEKIEDIDTLVAKIIHLKNPDSLTVKPADIQKLIQGQLIQNNLPYTFYFALLKPNGGYVYKSIGFADTSACYKISLYPNDLFGRNILLSVNIPGRLAYIHSDIWGVFAMSLILTLSLLLLFLYSIQMLIRHKNLLAAKNDFINHMSHEIKTPLAGISLGADMLMEKNSIMTHEQIVKVAHSIKEQSSRLHKDISAVLLNSLVDETPAIKFNSFSITDTINRTIHEFKLILEDKQGRVETFFSSDKILFSGNEMLWQKVFCNLIDNSIKFSSGGGLLISIGLSFPDSNHLLIRFSDNGVGVSKEDIPHIFEKFYRSDYYRQSHIQGFGLGLSFVKKIVEMHHGTIKAESEQGKGTTIHILLPTHD
jgi:two-component system phosphate regulon sensor histidine kinase PhoR